ncbi:MAG: hypothetical protein JO307_34240 [Bryobacterales bacterium]|nr:hypothetical protein [Bryobacterales bacterium]MBV9401669.1 hypothetical protein [Bryobacterales bacterium]
MKSAALFVFCLVPACLHAQESALAADFRGESERFKDSCASGFSFGKIASCADLLATDHPLHVALGSLAPQNGFGSGLAFVSHLTPNESWRLSWSVDAVATSNASWRAGGYLTAVLVRHPKIVVQPGGPGSSGGSEPSIQEFPVFHAYAQGISLNTLTFFGLGPNTVDTARSYYGMTQTITGVNAVWPVLQKLNMSLYGEANGRFVNLRGSYGNSSPSIEQLYNNATAPGLAGQPAFAQFGEGIRARPVFAADYVRLNYFFNYQQYVASGSIYSFQRFTTDLGHQIALYRKTRLPYTRDYNGPNDCSSDPSVHKCPSPTRDLQGSIGFRFIYSQSMTAANHVVPFYFQQTLGGSDINGTPFLASYQDYRFRAPNLMLLRGSFEHSLPGKLSPLGVAFNADFGKVALSRSALSSTPFLHSYSTGLTLRAGGFPEVWLLYAWGGHEGVHTIGAMNTSLLGGSARPSLY